MGLLDHHASIRTARRATALVRLTPTDRASAMPQLIECQQPTTPALACSQHTKLALATETSNATPVTLASVMLDMVAAVANTQVLLNATAKVPPCLMALVHATVVLLGHSANIRTQQRATMVVSPNPTDRAFATITMRVRRANTPAPSHATATAPPSKTDRAPATKVTLVPHANTRMQSPATTLAPSLKPVGAYATAR
jgi:hypothetical protein